MTWQVSPRNKVNGFADTQSYQSEGTRANDRAGGTHRVELLAAGAVSGHLELARDQQVPARSRRVADEERLSPARASRSTDIFGFAVKPTDISILEASTGFRYNARSSYRYTQRPGPLRRSGSPRPTSPAPMPSRPGSNCSSASSTQDTVVNQRRGRTPSCGACRRTITQWATPYQNKIRTKADLGLFAQDQWTIKRLTLNYGLRFDYFNGYVPAQHVPPGAFVGARDFAPVHDVPNWTDLNPRLGASYDLFGTAGRRSRRRSAGMWARWGPTSPRPTTRSLTSVNSVNRTWNDANGNYVPDCDLTQFRRERRMRADQQCQLRQDQSQRRPVCRRPDPRVRQPRLLLGPVGGSAAPARAAGVGDGRLLPQLDVTTSASLRQHRCRAVGRPASPTTWR